MRHCMPLAIACVLVGAGILSAQQRSSLGPPESSSATAPTPLPLSLPTSQATPALGPPLNSSAASPASQVAPVVGPPPTPSAGLPASQVVPAVGPPPNSYTPSAPYTVVPGAYSQPYAPPPVEGYEPLFFPRSHFAFGDRASNPSIWLGVEGLLVWTKNQPLSVPVITTGPASQGANAGNLGAPGTTSLNGPLDYGVTGGVRFFAGGWFDVGHTIGMDGSIFFLGRQSAGFGALDRSGNGSFVINEPVTGAPFTTQVSAPGVATGGMAVDARSRFGGGDVNFLYDLYRAGGWTINLLAGYRYLELDETLSITANSNTFVTSTFSDNMGNMLASAPPGSTIVVQDRFGTRSQFNGGQLGAEFQYLQDR
jgi:hypothetical protein